MTKLTEHREEICRRYLAGETTTALAASFGVTAPSIVYQLLKGGVEMRSALQRAALRDAQRRTAPPTDHLEQRWMAMVPDIVAAALRAGDQP